MGFFHEVLFLMLDSVTVLFGHASRDSWDFPRSGAQGGSRVGRCALQEVAQRESEIDVVLREHKGTTWNAVLRYLECFLSSVLC